MSWKADVKESSYLSPVHYRRGLTGSQPCVFQGKKNPFNKWFKMIKPEITHPTFILMRVQFIIAFCIRQTVLKFFFFPL